MYKPKQKNIAILSLVLALSLLLSACGGAAAPAAVAPAPAAASPTTINIVQTGALQPVAVGAQPSGWETTESIRGGLHLVATYDSSGPDAWDVAAHPLVYVTSESSYNENPDLDVKLDAGAANFAGFHIIDAYSKQVITSGLYSFEGNISRGPHGTIVSPDGKWAYVGFSETPPGGGRGDRISYVAVINVRTMKMDKVMKQWSYYQGKMRSQALHHLQAFKDFEGNDRVLLMWGFGADGGPHFLLDPNDNNRVVKAITYDDVHPMGHPFITPDPTGRYLYISMGAPEIREAPFRAAGIAKLDLKDGSVIEIPGVGNHPIGITHTADGKFTYVIEGSNSLVFKIDNETNEVVGVTSAGVAGPYGLALNWDETELYTIGKGEGSHNRGNVVGLIDTTIFRPSRAIRQPIVLGGSAQSIDHGILHPDPEVNELWISNMKGWETIVLDLDTKETTALIPTPNGGDTHSGGFVRYNADWTGELLVDQGGPKSQSIWDLKKAKIEAASR